MFRRKRYFISRLQYGVVLTVLLYFAMVIVAIAASVTVPFLLQTTKGVTGTGSFNLANGLLYFHRNVWPVLVPVIALICVHAILLSHRVVGPLYRFRRVMESIGSGDLTVSAKIRTKDLLWEESDAMNAMIASLARDVGEIQNNQERLRGSLRRLSSHLHESVDDETVECVVALEHDVEQLQTAVERFRTSSDQPVQEDPAVAGSDSDGSTQGSSTPGGEDHSAPNTAEGPERREDAA